MKQDASQSSRIAKWLGLYGLLWVVGLVLYPSLVSILFYGAGRYGLYSLCPQTIELHISTSP